MTEKTFEELKKLKDKDFVEEYLKLRDETEWGIDADFQVKNKLLNDMVQEIRKRKILDGEKNV
jgi:hypothetical protein